MMMMMMMMMIIIIIEHSRQVLIVGYIYGLTVAKGFDGMIGRSHSRTKSNNPMYGGTKKTLSKSQEARKKTNSSHTKSSFPLFEVINTNMCSLQPRPHPISPPARSSN
jgi:hypothetical protein